MNHISDDPKECSLCFKSSRSFEVVGDFVYGGTSQQKFYVCPHCDAAFIHPAMNEDEEAKFYSKEFEKFMEKRAGSDFDWSGPEAHIKSNEKQYLRREPFFSDLISKQKSVLEIGCSSGFMLFPLKDKVKNVVGIEPSSRFRNFLRSKGIEVFNSLDILRKTDAEAKFDIVMHFFVLEHVRDPLGFLKECLALLAKGGSLVFEVPNRSDPLVSIYNIPAFHKFYWSVAHRFYFNRKSLEFVLKSLGANFEIMNEQRYDLSNHMNWALEGKPGGQGKFSNLFTSELDKAYLESMKKTGHCDTLVVRVEKD